MIIVGIEVRKHRAVIEDRDFDTGWSIRARARQSFDLVGVFAGRG